MHDLAMDSPERERRGSIALDQWRGLAVILVLISHGFYFSGRVHGIGRVGVNLFFFISGVLVFRSLAFSKAPGDWQRARSFWWRRLRRLYPAMLAYVAPMLLITWELYQIPEWRTVADLGTYMRDIPFALTYLVNYGPGQNMSLGHLWSLGCEMQFYFLAPFIWIAAGREPKRFVVFALVLAVLVSLGMVQPLIGRWKYHFEFAVWPMMLGFFCEYKRNWFLRIPVRIVNLLLWLALAVCAGSMICMLFGQEMKTLVIAIGALLLLPCFLSYRFGRSMPGLPGYGMEWIGVRTYSIYLWQQPLTLCHFLPTVWQPLGAMAAVGVGAVSYRFFEFPFLSAGRQKQERARAVA
jgi:peptidoglycan/LPS O-acetylase OafA/YrhL